MTDAEWFSDLLQEEWGESDLSPDIDEPLIFEEGEDEPRQRSIQADQDIVAVEDGGDPVIEPRSLGHRDEYVESRLSVDIQTNESREHLVGRIGEPYTGMKGEVKRICDKYRNGMHDDAPVADPGFDKLVFETFEDEVAQRGTNLWGGVWTVIFKSFAESIEQEPVRP